MTDSELARKLGVSRQMIWARKKVAEGKCRICGNKSSADSRGYCRKHFLEDRKRSRERYRNLSPVAKAKYIKRVVHVRMKRKAQAEKGHRMAVALVREHG